MAILEAKGQLLQVRKQADLWTAPAGTAWQRPQNMSIVPQPVMENRDEIYLEGANWPTGVEVGTEHSTFAISGRPSFNELHIPMNMMFGSGTPTAGAAGDAAAITRSWVGTQYTALARNYYAFEKGIAANFRRFSANHVQTFGIETDRVSQSISGNGIGRVMAYGLSSGLGTGSDITTAKFDKNKWSVRADTTFSGLQINQATNQLGTTALGVHGANVYNVSWNIGDLTQVLWTVDDRQLSWADVAGGDTPNTRLELTVDATAAGESYIANARAGSTVYFRLLNEGLVVPGTAAFQIFRIDMAMQVLDVQEYATTMGAFTVGYTLAGIWDGTQTFTVTLVNAMATD